ncbi:MAG: hypothetical protein A3D28_04905 [Omnitrophica bacterium RIFCSPHIGHO2_02_FULL_63_14]|nr:MAG: hypothetical protein A3D28_04905 [Omnitrophica bacterium RIFCSPHIGHO2_02_FULL_63_14]
METRAHVTFEQILADPDNIELNFRYAKTQVARNDVRGAAATLERILLVDPALTQVKLFYGIVLFRLDNLEEAERVLRDVRERPMPPSLRAEVDGYLREIRLRRQATRFAASLGLGYQFDTNRNAAPSSKQRLLSDSPIGLSGTSRKRRDTSLLLIESLGFTHDLGFQAGHQLIGSFDHFLGEQTTVDDLDLQAFSFEGGAIVRTWLADVTATGFFDHVSLSRETFLLSPGVNVALQRDLTKRLNLFAANRWTHEDFHGITENAAAPERTGDRDIVSGGARYALSPAMAVTAGLAYENKQAKAPYNAYDGFALNGSHTWLLGKGQFAINAISYGLNVYDEPDRAISARTRRDKQLRVRCTYGAPVSLFLGRLLPAIISNDLTTTLSYEYFRSLSTVTNYTYLNSKITWMLAKRVEF